MEQYDGHITIDVPNHIDSAGYDETGETPLANPPESDDPHLSMDTDPFSANSPDVEKSENLNRENLPDIRQFNLLNDEVDSTDIGRTIKDMFNSIESMEKQLNSVLAINAALEKDNKALKETVVELRAEKYQLENIIENMKDELPFKKELQAEVEHFIEERNNAQKDIQIMKSFTDKAKGQSLAYKMRIAELESEKGDLLKDIQYLEAKVNKAVEKLNAYGKEIHVLRGERLSNMEKLKNVHIQYKECLDERNRLLDRTLS
ncbi:MAG: hypothetical protein HQK89_03290 [Nitrospirae bacterium]|nr:hypothetical protein [Nitrospirota bacterium]